MSEPKKITEMYAWICTEPDGGEGVPAAEVNGVAMPLMGADVERAESLRPWAEFVAKQKGYPVKLVKFTNMEVIEVIKSDDH